MGSRGLVLTRFTWISTLLLSVLLLILPSMVKAQVLGCSIQGVEGLDLQPCLNQQDKSSMYSCCLSLNQLVKAGYHCLCLVLSSSTSPFSSSPLSLPFANCYISAPPLTQCPGNSNAPRILPPITDGREPVTPPSSIATIFMSPPPPPLQLPIGMQTSMSPPPPPLQLPIGMQTSMNLTQGRNLTRVEEEEPHSNNNVAVKSTMADNTGGNARSYIYSGECRKQAKIWTYPGVVCIVVTVLRTCFL